jgi:hypothetical protein
MPIRMPTVSKVSKVAAATMFHPKYHPLSRASAKSVSPSFYIGMQRASRKGNGDRLDEIELYGKSEKSRFTWCSLRAAKLSFRTK